MQVLLRGLLQIGLAIAWTGCTTVETWDQGFPRTAKELHDPRQRASEYEKFAITDINERFVTIKDRHYTRESFEPILRHATPAVVDELDRAGADADISMAVATAVLGTASFTIPDGLPAALGAARDVATGGAYGVSLYKGEVSESEFKECKTEYLQALAQRLGLPVPP